MEADSSGNAFWHLSFDGSAFTLTEAESPPAPTQDRVVEEVAETILMLWGHVLLPGPRLRFIGREAVLCQQADVFALDPLGRLHLFEMKQKNPASVGQKELSQMISYLINRPTREEEIQSIVLESHWYGLTALAISLGGLIAGQRLGNKRAEDLKNDARYPERAAGLLRLASKLAGQRFGKPLSADALKGIASKHLERMLGCVHDSWITDPSRLWDEFKSRTLGPGWALENTAPPTVTWLLAPKFKDGLDNAHLLIERGIDLRFVEFDVREVRPGCEWSVTLGWPDGRRWAERDRLAGLLSEVRKRHVQRFPENAKRVLVELNSKEEKKVGSFGWSGLASHAQVELSLNGSQLAWKWYSHWWTEGEALKYRHKMNAVGKKLSKSHPRTFPFPTEGDCEESLVDALTRLVDDAWLLVVATGAHKADKWARFTAPPG